MNKENQRNAAGLRRSALAERIRLREEWSALKGTDNLPLRASTKNNNTNTKQRVTRSTNKKVTDIQGGNNDNVNINKQVTSDVLRGVVALVEVGSVTRALALRAALTALGASVVPRWSPLITHLIWSEGGCRDVRRRARALACRVLSPLWVEACAAAGARLPDAAFPAPPRPSDLPSPRTLKILLKKAEMENISLNDLLDTSDEKMQQKMRLRMSSETEQDTTHTTDTSRDTSHDKSRDKTGTMLGVKTAPAPEMAGKSRRKLFTEREAMLEKSNADKDDNRENAPRRTLAKITEREKRKLTRARQMARILAGNTSLRTTQNTTDIRIVLTGMCRSERRAVYNAIKTLNGHIQKHVNRKTTHVLLGSCKQSNDFNISGVTPCLPNTSSSPNKFGNTRNSPRKNIANKPLNPSQKNCDGNTELIVIPGCGKQRTFNALAGAARGCRVLYAQWAIDSMVAKKWLHHQPYEVMHLRKISQKARVERSTLFKRNSEYAYNVFSGMRLRISPSAGQRDAAIQLLKLCGAVVQNGENREQNGGDGVAQNGGTLSTDCDLVIGCAKGEVNSKWVFDSVAAARMRTTRRYVNNGNNNCDGSNDVVFVSQNTNR